ncbi:tetratricopeptide repeat protein 23 isoform X1 [Oncorhynchus kisutch]|uniref:tetratricopeptide repeat protein 23 isoform X1 n=2 Tax=Oncorhynchus kisutch TaxID=8019 RepID=UPI0012DF0FE7|nr:tetratricopeptide repeat protein 23 isoform X1 [Oncorhynchus kisutch]
MSQEGQKDYQGQQPPEPLPVHPATIQKASDKGLASVSQRGMDDTGESMMMTPEEKLTQYDSRAQAFADTQQFDACIQDLVRCVALTRLVYGDGQLKLAQAHVRLAKAYLQFKGWAVQAQEHSARASDLLPFCTPNSTSREDRVHILTCLLNIYLTQGGATLLLANLEEAEYNYRKAEKIVVELHQLGGMSKEEKMETEFEISTSLSRVYQRQGRSEEALGQCESSLQLLEGWERPGQACSVYKDMAAIEQAQGRLDRALEHLSKAHAIALSQSPGGLDGAHIAHSLALAYSTVAEPHHNDSAAHYYEESLSTYRSSLGPQATVTLNLQDDYCRFLLLTGQQERCVEIQRESLALKRETFGDLSPEVADTLQLIGGVQMTQGQVKHAHRTMSKCLDIQSILYGPQHKKTRATQKTVDMLAQAPEVAGRQRREGSLKTRPPFCAVLPSYSKAGGNANMSDS